MRVFEPEPTRSSSEIANWVFIRSVIVFFLALHGATIVKAMVGTGIPIWVIGLWFWFQLLFRGIGAYEQVNEGGVRADRMQ